jgi:prophage regulatory protein
MQTLVERLRTDFGKKTFGELMQEREAAAGEIERLTCELALSRAKESEQSLSRSPRMFVTRDVTDVRRDGRVLLRLRDVCEMVGLSRSTIYSAMNVGSFPRSIPVGARSVRWKASDVATWLKARCARSP